MGLLDGLLGNVLGGALGGRPQQTAAPDMAAQGLNPLVQIALQLLQQNGGLGALLQRFQQAGFGDHAQSWVSTGQNMPINADILQQVLGRGQIGQIAQQMGVSHEETAGGLASMLPQIVDQMTPQGAVPDNANDLVSQVLAQLQRNR
jgi:uncharacterized protein YidB (DUF937 family)